MTTVQRDLVAIAWVAVCLWLLRHELFGREPQGDQAAALHPSTNLPLDVAPGDSASSRPEPFLIHPDASWSADAVERVLEEIKAL